MHNTNILTTALLPKLSARSADCHKGQLGRALIVAGGSGMGGAGLLAVQSCLRMGAGLVSLATMPEHVSASLARQPEVMVRAVLEVDELQPLLQQASVVLVGSGLGQGEWATSLLAAVANTVIAQVWDADALNLLARDNQRWCAKRSWVLTPHPGEAARLLSCSVQDIQTQREHSALKIAEKYHAVVVLKGANTVIASPELEVRLCQQGHPVMAGAGFGDVLGGVIAALIAQGMTAFDASCLAVYVHASAGEKLAAFGRGAAASDLIVPMREVLEQLCPVTK